MRGQPVDELHIFIVNLLTYSSGAAGIAFLMFRFWGEKWIENKFKKQLEEDRHTHAKELQDLKKKLDSELNRTLKIQEKEFEVLSEAWEKLKVAENGMRVAVSLARLGIDIDKFSPSELDEFLSKRKFMEVHKLQLKEAKDKSKFYDEIIVRYELSDALVAFHDFLSYIRKNSIFIRPQIEEKFLKIEEKMREVISLKQTDQIMNGTQRDVNYALEAYKKVEEEIQPLISNLNKEIRVTLHKDE